MTKAMLAGDPVPGIELFLEEEPDDEPIANGTTDANGGCRLVLPAGTFNVRAMLPRDTGIAISSILIRVSDGRSFIGSKALAVPFDRAGSSPVKYPITLANKSESVHFEVLVLDARNPVEQALLTGLFQRELQSASCAALMNELIATISAKFGSASEVIDNTQNTTWPPPIGIDKSLVFNIETPAGRLQITISAVVRLVQGKPVLEAGGRQACSVEEAHKLASELHGAILKSLTELRGLAKGVTIILFVPDVVTKGANSKGGFAVGGFSTL